MMNGPDRIEDHYYAQVAGEVADSLRETAAELAGAVTVLLRNAQPAEDDAAGELLAALRMVSSRAAMLTEADARMLEELRERAGLYARWDRTEGRAPAG